MDEGCSRIDAKTHLVVKSPHCLLNTLIEVGQLGRVTGKPESNTIIVQRQIILGGDVAAAKAANEASPNASWRQVALGSMLDEILEAM